MRAGKFAGRGFAHPDTHMCPAENRSRNTLCLLLFHGPDGNWKHKNSAVGRYQTTQSRAVGICTCLNVGCGGSSLCAPSTPDGETWADPEGSSCPLNEAVKCEQVFVIHLFTSRERQCEARRLVH